MKIDKNILTATLVLVVCQPVISFGFNSDEHTLLGNVAIMTAAEEYGCFKNENISGKRKKICEVIVKISNTNAGDPDVPSYGDIISNVDDFLTPEKLISVCSTSAKGLPASWPSNRCEASKTTFFQASHANHTHFQKEVLISQSTYHLLAVSIAGVNDNLEGALFVNAIANHYLQDYFAPGHITTPRSKTSDLFSTALHDAANKTGANFHLNNGNYYERLLGEIADIKKIITGSQSDVNSQLISFLFAKDSINSSYCSLDDFNFVKGDVVHLKGDSFLLRKVDGCKQRIVMLAINIISIKDVLSSYEYNKVVNSFDSYHWKYETDGWLPDIRADIPFGYYALGSNSESIDDNDKNLPTDHDVVFGLSVSKEYFNANQHVSRTNTTLETVPLGFIGNGFFKNVGIAFGYDHYEGDGNVSGNGGLLRLGFIIPETESTWSVGLRRLRHSGTLENSWKNGYNLRYDQGYTSMFSLFLSVGKDYAAIPSGQLNQGTYLAAGLMIAAPSGRILNCIHAIFSCL